MDLVSPIILEGFHALASLNLDQAMSDSTSNVPTNAPQNLPPEAKSNQAPNPEIAFFKHFGDKQGTNHALFEILDQIKQGRWKREIEHLRSLSLLDDQEPFNREKKKLPCFMVSASTKQGHHKTDIKAHSGLLQIDVDKLPSWEDAKALRDRLINDPHIMAAWLSPSGLGVKAVMMIPPSLEAHAASFASAQKRLRDLYVITIDPSCKDVNRLCFVSYDPELKINSNAYPQPIDPSFLSLFLNQKRTSKPKKKPTSSSLLSSPSYSSKFVSSILDITSQEWSLVRDWPELLKLYEKLVEPFLGPPQKGTRNQVTIEMVSSMFYFVAPQAVEAFVREYRRRNTACFDDYPLETHLNEVRSHLSAMEERFKNETLSVAERECYNKLASRPDDRQQVAFRICRSLAYYDSEPQFPPPTFFISMKTLAVRLCLICSQADRVLDSLLASGCIELVQKGTQRQKGQAPRASVYAWVLDK